MRTGIVDEDDGRGEGECARQDLDEQHTRESGVERNAAGLSGRSSRRGHDGQVRRKTVRDREEQEAETETADGAESLRQDRVEEELQRDAYGAEDGHCEADRGRRHSEAAGEAEWEGLSMVPRGVWLGRVEARGGEKDEPQVLEAADVEGHNGMYNEGTENIAGPEATERKLGFGSRWGGC